MRRITSILLLIALVLSSGGVAADLHRAQHADAHSHAVGEIGPAEHKHHRCSHHHGSPSRVPDPAAGAIHAAAHDHHDDHCQICVDLHTRVMQSDTPAADHSVDDAGKTVPPLDWQVQAVSAAIHIDCTGPPGR